MCVMDVTALKLPQGISSLSPSKQPLTNWQIRDVHQWNNQENLFIVERSVFLLQSARLLRGHLTRIKLTLHKATSAMGQVFLQLTSSGPIRTQVAKACTNNSGLNTQSSRHGPGGAVRLLGVDGDLRSTLTNLIIGIEV